MISVLRTTGPDLVLIWVQSESLNGPTEPHQWITEPYGLQHGPGITRGTLCLVLQNKVLFTNTTDADLVQRWHRLLTDPSGPDRHIDETCAGPGFGWDPGLGLVCIFSSTTQ